MVARLFGRFPVVDLNPDELIGLGAAVQAGLKMRDAALDEVVMTDVAPYSLGVEVVRQVQPQRTVSGYYLPIINRNSVVPISRVETVYTVQDRQELVTVRIFQGESPMVADNIFLGELNVPVPPKAAGANALDIRFTYDIDGLLEAAVVVKETGATHALVIEENPGVLSPAEIAQRLAALQDIKIHPREQMRNRSTIARAERLYQELLGQPRELISEALAAFHAALDGQEPGQIAAVHLSVCKLLDQLDQAPQLFQD